MRIASIGLLGVAFVFGGVLPASAQESNLLRNTGFEEEGLNHWGVTGTAQRLERGDWHPRAGKWSFGIGNDGGPQDAFGEIAQVADLPEAVAGRKCVFSVWLLTEPEHAGSLLMKLQFVNEGGEMIREVSRPAAGSKKQEWRPARMYGIVPAGATRVRAAFVNERMKSGRGQSFVWIDDAGVVVE